MRREDELSAAFRCADVRGGQQRARAAREIGDRKPLVAGQIAPVGIETACGEFGEQGGTGRPGVEGREVLATPTSAS